VIAFAAATVPLAILPGRASAEPSIGDYVGKTNAEITKTLIRQGYRFREFNREESNLLEAEVVLNGNPYEIFVDPDTGRIVKMIAGDEPNEIPVFKCAQRAEFVQYLGDKFQEKPVAMGVTGNGGITELLMSSNGVSWTIIKTTPNGIACQMAAGEYWQLHGTRQLREQ
jgi:hypothetical protein